ncbi:DNA-binding transcriptional regulator, LysR family [Jeotgalicoccus aerolatus]|uniref:DNA-binding transcriptional regulator, LysR family n=1 Tax=Jeotgalicoccus aerolatus TaxID=709510 RepID=A0A1G8XMY9_9STAP|nr:LysR family transcriptional regulator [Jeotgalicoccus aerolatus]SDJ91941.1 DNA-binding transcriptional regulator, LysR family [Jeotgalicoccus aerolatus]
MSYKRLYYFFVLAQKLNYSEAAKAAGIKQPTLSQQINVLEEEMNVRLFYRNSKKVMLTTAGEKLFEKLFDLKKELDTTINNLKPEHSNDTVLKIGVMQGELTDLIANVMIQFKRIYPNVQVIFYTLDLSTSLLEKGELDLYFDYDASDKKDNMTYLYEDGFNIIYTDKFKKINTDKLAEYPWILMNRQYSCRRIFSELENSNELEIVPIMELSDLAVVYNMVNNGLGVSLVSDTSLLFYDSDDLNVLKVKTEGLKRNVVMHHNGNLNINQHHQEFYNMTVNELKKLRIIK